MSDLNIRLATPEDAAAVARIHVASWQEAYVGIVPTEFLDQLSIEEKAAFWRRVLSNQADKVLVRTQGPTVLGFASYGAHRDASATAGDGEVRAIYVDPACWSQGTGRLLCREVLDRLAVEGYRTAFVWVLAENTRAVRFYKLMGFRESEEKERNIGGKALRMLCFCQTVSKPNKAARQHDRTILTVD